MKKILLLMAIALMLMMSVCGMVACGGNEGEGENEGCTEHVDLNDDFLCDECGETFIPDEGDDDAAEVTLTVKAKDHYGNPIAGLVIDFICEDEPDYDVTSDATDANGEVKVTIHVGEYGVEYTNTPIYHIPGKNSVIIAENTTEWEVEFTNNTPNGTQEHPYFFDEENPSITMGVGASHYYRAYHAKGLVLYLQGEGYKVTYNGKEYVPEEGTLQVVFTEEDMNSAALVLIENATDSEITFTANIYSAPGSIDNPHVIEHNGEPVTVVAEDVLYDYTVYYSYAVSGAGKVVLSTESEKIHMVLINGDRVENVDTDEEKKSVSINVNEGDVIKISITTTDKGAAEVGVDIAFVVALESTTEG